LCLEDPARHCQRRIVRQRIKRGTRISAEKNDMDTILDPGGGEGVKKEKEIEKKRKKRKLICFGVFLDLHNGTNLERFLSWFLKKMKGEGGGGVGQFRSAASGRTTCSCQT